MDMTAAIAPKSDQLNSDDLITGPRTFTIASVEQGNDEQPVNVYLAEFPKGRPWRPGKSMGRILVAAWGRDSDAYIGRRLTLFRDPTITFGRDAVGGVRVSHMSHLPDNRPLKTPLTVTRGKKALYTVEPLPDSTPSSPPVDEETVRALADLRAEYKSADDERKAQILAEVERLQGGTA